MNGNRHTHDSLEAALKAKGLDTLSVVSIDYDNNTVIVKDSTYGDYSVDLKSFTPKTAFPLHKRRKHINKLQAMRDKLIGQELNGLKVVNIFYGPDNGYKNRSFYIEVTGTCGHSSINTYAAFTKQKKTFSCVSCKPIKHGERAKIDGKLKKRTSTYIHWQRIKKTLPAKYQEYGDFLRDAGEKRFTRAEVQFLNDKPLWVNLKIVADEDLNLMSMSLRQAFRHSQLYKDAVEAAKVETAEGTRYRCAICKDLYPRSFIQVDHITPVADVDGAPLTKDNMVERIWTKHIQILDKKCHLKKSTLENSTRKANKSSKTPKKEI